MANVVLPAPVWVRRVSVSVSKQPMTEFGGSFPPSPAPAPHTLIVTTQAKTACTNKGEMYVYIYIYMLLQFSHQSCQKWKWKYSLCWGADPKWAVTSLWSWLCNYQPPSFLFFSRQKILGNYFNAAECIQFNSLHKWTEESLIHLIKYFVPCQRQLLKTFPFLLSYTPTHTHSLSLLSSLIDLEWCASLSTMSIPTLERFYLRSVIFFLSSPGLHPCLVTWCNTAPQIQMISSMAAEFYPEESKDDAANFQLVGTLRHHSSKKPKWVHEIVDVSWEWD